MQSGDWLEQQYWADVMAVRPNERIERQQQLSAEARENATLVHKAYGEHERQGLDLFMPPGEGPFPLLVFVHGGYWQLGDKSDWSFLAPEWNANGIGLATVGYRLAPEVSVEQIIDDVAAAVNHLVQHAQDWRIDPKRIAASGISAGAQLVAQALAFGAGGSAKAAVLISGVYDLSPLQATTPGKVLGSWEPGDPRVSPLGRAPTSACRSLVAVGSAETDVFKSQSQALAAHLTNHGFPCPAHELPGANHFTVVDALRASSDGPVASFIKSELAAQ